MGDETKIIAVIGDYILETVLNDCRNKGWSDRDIAVAMFGVGQSILYVQDAGALKSALAASIVFMGLKQ